MYLAVHHDSEREKDLRELFIMLDCNCDGYIDSSDLNHGNCIYLDTRSTIKDSQAEPVEASNA